MIRFYLLVILFLPRIAFGQNNSKAQPKQKPAIEEEIITEFESMPEFPDGFEAMYKYIQDSIVYPPMALDAGLQGKVFVEFTVQQDGSLTDFIIARGIGRGCDAEAIRVLSAMPSWNPAIQRGKPVGCRFVMPIAFEIPKGPPRVRKHRRKNK